MNKLPAVAIFCYNRLEHLKKTILSLENNLNYQSYNIYIFSDGPKNLSDSKKIKKIRNFLFSLKNKKIKIIQNKVNLGLKQNIIKGLNNIFKTYESAIVIEDDLILNKYFLNYMSHSIKFYKTKKSIGSISSYTPIKSNHAKRFEDDVYFTRRHYSWGWATWANIWNNFVFDENKLKRMINKRTLDGFGRIGKDLPILLKLSLNNDISSWSIFFDYNCYINKLLCVCPKFSIVKNLGFDNSGTHIHQDFLNNNYMKNWAPIKFANPRLLKEIEKLEQLSIEGNFTQKLKNKFVRIKGILYKIVKQFR